MSKRTRSRCGKRERVSTERIYRPDGSVKMRFAVNGRKSARRNYPEGTMLHPVEVDTIERESYGESVAPRTVHTVWIKATDRQMRRLLHYWEKRGVKLNPLVKGGFPIMDDECAVYRVNGPADVLGQFRFDERVVRYEEAFVSRHSLGTSRLCRRPK